ncbi:Conjugal transfer protein [Rubrivivax sp. A210]|uniref:TraU family protein n=1 Tax=Rubrivivax sp. A210 TaxID=2772301 RepID=UPI0019198906|nr:TraU family protein [Rubrivivax sp. A210]CAD5366859.1 Conjugal transfer protein [Rubrivivax sp. A210]
MSFLKLLSRLLRTLRARLGRGSRQILAALVACTAVGSAQAVVTGGGSAIGEVTCYGEWANPISDICWQCIFPISIGAFAVEAGQEDIENPGSPICFCPIPLPPYYRMGLEIGFWEPTRLVEHTRTPFCFPSLGGMYMSGGDAFKPPGAQSYVSRDRVSRDGFYQTHLYANPLLYYLNALLDQQCLESGSLDLAYMSEYDSAWHDDEETAILEPEAPLFANLLAIAACSVDCTMASVGFGIRELFWCSGCNGPVYPMNGNVPVHIGGIQASSLLTHRILAKLHRLFIAWQWHGEGAVCNGYPAPLMDKRGYKTQLVYPIPLVGGTDGTGLNRCCQPLGRTTQIWGMGREYPIRGEDFSYQVFRKRNCCVSD